jgi:regulatory protein
MPDDRERCYAAALRILSYRFNSEGELRRKLAGKNFERETIDAVIDKLRRENWIDDDRFAAAFVRTRVRKGIGRLRIKRELTAAGVSAGIIATAIGENVPAEGERAAAEKLARKKFTLVRRRSDAEAARNKVAAYLQRQGYDTAVVIEIVRKL